jgi:hypothetical protein
MWAVWVLCALGIRMTGVQYYRSGYKPPDPIG